jgi:hypothetical protein
VNLREIERKNFPKKNGGKTPTEQCEAEEKKI